MSSMNIAIFWRWSCSMLVGLFFSQAVISQNITSHEYFWDNDPGLGMGTPVNVGSPASDVTANFNISTAGLSGGMHRLFVRALNSQSKRSNTIVRDVYIRRNLVSAEYFWDSDPGHGNGTPMNTTGNGEELSGCHSISTAGLSAGIHYLYVRSKSSDGVWSIAIANAVSITESAVNTGCAGDFDRNSFINSSDLLTFLAVYGGSEVCGYDLTGDGAINTSDVLIFLGLFGTSCP